MAEGHGTPEDHLEQFRMWASGNVWTVIEDRRPGLSGIYADDAEAALAYYRENHETEDEAEEPTTAETAGAIDLLEPGGPYLVTWQIDSDEVSPVQAALDAWRQNFRRGLHQPAHDDACIFTVLDRATGRSVKIDLSEERLTSLWGRQSRSGIETDICNDRSSLWAPAGASAGSTSRVRSEKERASRPMKNLVQAIAVVPGTHFETIAAVATASAIAACQRESDPEAWQTASAIAACQRESDPEAWQTWFDQSFTKTVRRAKRPAEIDKLDLDELVVHRHTSGRARAYAYAPMAYDEFPAHLRRLQVAGLDVDLGLDADRHFWRSEHESCSPQLDPRVVIDDQLEMSTGKTAAQVAHALVGWVQALTCPARGAWVKSPALQLLVADLDTVPNKHSVTVRDNGLTEIEPGTATVRIALP